ncbi:MAG: histidine kinase dimerization/phosphoacceptor domain -containing protein [Deltaproteobacteria bacterium]|nr:histidine kinase dimerization/phosphoacceptor domain -containing protein [Deltaproteobacteria bacterium]
MESAPDAMIVVDAEGWILLVNAQAETLFGYGRAELLGSRVDLLVPDRARASHQTHREAYGQAPRFRGMGSGIALSGRRKDGSEIAIEISLSPIETDEGTLIASAIRDVTQRAAADRALRSSLLEKEVLLKEVHHRVKNNLQVIASLIHLQAMSAPDAARSHFADTQARVHAMAALHERLYRAADLAHIDMAGYLGDVVAHLARAHSVVDVTVAVHVDPVAFRIDDAVPVGLIVTELVTNAFKHGYQAGEGGCVRVELRACGDELTLVIADDGRGLPSDHDPTAAGTLGMKLVRGLARQLDGQLELSSPPRGVRWELRFPRVVERTS